MIKKIGAFFEEHIEKIILILVGILCSWLLITRVMLTPNVVEYDGKTYGPGNIDEKIYEDAREAKNNPKNVSTVDPIVVTSGKNFAELFNDPLKDIATNFPPERPWEPPNPPDEKYDKPVIGKVTNEDIEYLRAVVYQPTSPVTAETSYDVGISEPNDLDLVTVQGQIDVDKIYNEYYRCYVQNVKDNMTVDPCNAIPIFASVNLERQQKQPDGSWGPWKSVPRAKIDYNRDWFKVVKKPSDLPIGGYEVYKFRLYDKITQFELLQPEPADIEWFPPKLHREFVTAQKKDKNNAKLRETAATITTTDTNTGRRGSRGGNRSNINTGGIGTTIVGSTTGGRSRGGRRGQTGSDYNYNTTDTNTRRRGRTTTTNQPDTLITGSTGIYGQADLEVTKVYDDFEAMVLTEESNLSKMSEPLTFWAFDDTVKPENTYRYRISVGTLNPVFSDEDEGDDVVFWSEPSDVTAEVKVPGKLYFFPRAVQEAAKTVTVSVYKLVLGSWYKEDCKVAQGETIGDFADVELKFTMSDSENNTDTRITGTDAEIETVNFNTGAIMVDVAPVSEWLGADTLNPVPYYDMTYSYDGTDIRHFPVTSNYAIWPQDMYRTYIELQNRVNEKQDPFRAWGSSEIQVQQLRSGQYGGRIYRSNF